MTKTLVIGMPLAVIALCLTIAAAMPVIYGINASALTARVTALTSPPAPDLARDAMVASIRKCATAKATDAALRTRIMSADYVTAVADNATLACVDTAITAASTTGVRRKRTLAVAQTVLAHVLSQLSRSGKGGSP